MLAILSFYIARDQNEKPWKAIGEHLLIAVVVIVTTHCVGHWIGSAFG